MTDSLFKIDPEGRYVPTPLAVGPWNPAELHGSAVGGLLAHLIVDGSAVAGGMTIARLSVDILGALPMQPLEASFAVLREGRRVRLVEASLSFGGRVLAKASALLVRSAETIAAPVPLAHPLPEEIEAVWEPRPGRPLDFASERKVIRGGLQQLGPGAMWFKFNLECVAGVPLSPIVRSVMTADMGSAVGSAFAIDEWLFPNLDITLHFTRPPEGEWVLLEAHTEGAGNGLAIAHSALMDRSGVFARSDQTLFLARRE